MRCNVARYLCLSLFSAFFVLAAAGGGLAATDIDLTVELDQSGVLEATCYAGETPADRYVLTVTNTVTGDVLTRDMVVYQPLSLPELDATNVYTFAVQGLGLDGKAINESPLETVDIGGTKAAAASGGVMPSADKAFGMTFESGDASNFPFIYTNVRIPDVPTGCTIVESDFTAYEDGVLQTDFFDVILSGGVGGRLVDFVVIGDNSGSMSQERDSVVANVGAFADQLDAAGYDARFAFVRFGQSASSGNPIPVNNYGWADNAADFRTQYLSQWTAYGGIEPGLRSVQVAANGYAFRTGSARVFLLITDEPSNGGSDVSTAVACAAANAVNATVHAAVYCSGSSYYDYCGPGSITDCTGGMTFSVVANYGPILTTIGQTLNQIATVRYRTFNAVFDGVERNVRIVLNACGETHEVNWTYTPGEVPTIVRTPATILLSTSAQPEGQPLTLACEVTDLFPPFVNNVTLYYRTTGQTSYMSTPMSNVGGPIWEVVLPGSAVQRYGIDYYMRATDGIQAVTTPSVDASLVPHQIAVTPNFPPEIVVNTIDPRCEGEDMLVSVAVSDLTDYLDRVWLRYRGVGDLLYTEVEFTNVGGDDFEATVPGSALFAATDIELEIRAEDNYGVTSVFGPVVIEIVDCTGGGLACVWNDGTVGPLDNGGSDGHGVAWGDYDDDGDDDLFLANNGLNRLLRNDGGGVFVEVPLPGNDSYDSRGAAWGDYDNDGDPDLYVVNWGGPNFLLRNDGGTFVDVTAGDLACPLQGNNAAWADFDLDGDLDLFFTNYEGPNKLLRNDGGDIFNLVVSAVGYTDKSRGCAWGDYDNDQDPDLYVSVEDGPNHLFMNDNGVMVDVTLAPLDDMGKGKGVAWGDYDNDGDLDLYLVNRFTANRLFVNDRGVFSLSSDVVTADEGDGRACGWGDYNNDGWLDLFITNWDGANKLFHNTRGAFSDTTCGDLLNPVTAWGMGWNDHDGDGDIDLYVANHNYQNQPSHMFRNDLITNKSWLRVELNGTVSNREGIGARVLVTDLMTGDVQMREISAGAGYMSQQAAVAQFGLDEAGLVDIEIQWPSGIVQTLNNQRIDKRLVVTEAMGATDVDDIQKPRAYSVNNHPNPFNPMTKIEFAMPKAGAVTLNVYDVDGQLVKTLLGHVNYGVGIHSVTWNGTDVEDRQVASGVYFYRFVSGSHEQTGRMVLLK